MVTIPLRRLLVTTLAALLGAAGSAQAPTGATGPIHPDRSRHCRTVPDVPGGLASPSQTSSSVTLTWPAVGAPDHCSVFYDVYRNDTLVATVTSPTATVTGLAAATTYTFTVAAADAAGISDQSAGLKVATSGGATCTALPAVVTGLASPSRTSSSVALSWPAVSAPSGCSVFYYVYENGTLVATVTSPAATVTGLAAATAYTFTVASADGAGISRQSAGLPVTTAAGATCSTAPETPTGLASPSQTTSSVNLSWTAAGTPAGCSVTYDVHQDGKLVLTVPTTTAVLSGLAADTSYAFTVAAVDAAGVSAQSAPLSVQTSSGSAPTPAQVLAALTAQMTSATQVNTQPHINSQTQVADVNVYQVIPGVFAFSSSMAIDDDGSDPNSDPDHEDQTAWTTTDGQYLGAEHVPYYVLGDVCYDGESPCKWFYYAEHDITGLQFGLLFYNGKVIGSVFGDTQGPPGGDARDLGEASVEAASLLGIPDSGTTGGVNSGVTFVVFSGADWVLTGTNETLNASAQALVTKALSTLATGLGVNASNHSKEK